MYSGSITRASRSTTPESSVTRSARVPVGALRRASQPRTVLRAAPVAREIKQVQAIDLVVECGLSLVFWAKGETNRLPAEGPSRRS